MIDLLSDQLMLICFSLSLVTSSLQIFKNPNFFDFVISHTVTTNTIALMDTRNLFLDDVLSLLKLLGNDSQKKIFDDIANYEDESKEIEDYYILKHTLEATYKGLVVD